MGAVSVAVKDLSERAVRVELGIPADVAAKKCGVARNTLLMWELDPERAKPETRAACSRFYKALRHALEVAPGGS